MAHGCSIWGGAAALAFAISVCAAGCPGSAEPTQEDGACDQTDPELRDVCRLAGVWDLEEPGTAAYASLCNGMHARWYRDMCWLAAAQSPGSIGAVEIPSNDHEGGKWTPVSPRRWDLWTYCEQIHDPLWVEDCKLYLLDRFVGEIDPPIRLDICFDEMPSLQDVCVAHSIDRWAEGMVRQSEPGTRSELTSWFTREELEAQLAAMTPRSGRLPTPVLSLGRALLERAYPEDWTERCIGLPGARAVDCRPTLDLHQKGLMDLQAAAEIVWRGDGEGRWW
ncbi:MAG: hypothetical protein QGH45_03785 [Myxococcota bacterium]|jgi:hypothetical protein|nr:hypothetical protein [Myxococcota bacterium]